MSILDPAADLDQFLAAQGYDPAARAAALAALAAPTGAVPWEKFEPMVFAQYGPSLRALGTLRSIRACPERPPGAGGHVHRGSQHPAFDPPGCDPRSGPLPEHRERVAKARPVRLRACRRLRVLAGLTVRPASSSNLGSRGQAEGSPALDQGPNEGPARAPGRRRSRP